MSDKIKDLFMFDKAIRLEEEYHNNLLKFHDLIQTEEDMIIGTTPIKDHYLIKVNISMEQDDV